MHANLTRHCACEYAITTSRSTSTRSSPSISNATRTTHPRPHHLPKARRIRILHLSPTNREGRRGLIDANRIHLLTSAHVPITSNPYTKTLHQNPTTSTASTYRSTTIARRLAIGIISTIDASTRCRLPRRRSNNLCAVELGTAEVGAGAGVEG